MRLKEYPIGDYVGKCQTWNPKSSGVGSFDYIDLSSVDKDTKSIASIERYECSDAPSRARQLVETDDVLVATVRPNLNGAALVNSAHHGMTASTGYCVLRPDKDKLDSRFLFHWVKTGVFVQRMVDVATGANYPAVSDAKIKASKIPLPPLPEQKRIAGILDAADALRAKRREALAQLDTLLQSTFLDMFGDPVTNPMGWEVKPLNELLGEKFTNGAYYPKDAYSSVGTRMVHMANAFYGVVNPNEVKRVDAPLADIEKYGLLPTDILVSRRSLNYEGSAKPCLIPETDEPLIFESSLIRVRPDRERVLTIYLFHYLLNDRARAKYVFPLVTRSTISGISQSNLMKVKVVLPPLDLQHRFAAIVKSVEQQKASQRAHLAELDTLFASLQSRAFRGDL